MMKTAFRSFFGLTVAVLVSALVVAIGCENPGSYGEAKPIVYGRLVAYSSPTEPPMDNPRDEIWDNATAAGVYVTDAAFIDDTASIDSLTDSLTVQLEAIRTSQYLYLRAQWNENNLYTGRNYSVWQRPAIHILTTVISHIDTTVIPYDTTLDTTLDAWSRKSYRITSTGDTTWLLQDRFAVMWDAGDNGLEKADCRSMCHSRENLSVNGHRMYTTGGGHADVWHWQAGTTDPVFMAQDEYWDAEGRLTDAFNKEIFSDNYDVDALQPIYMHRDSTQFFKPFLHASDAVPFDDTLVWLEGNTIPAHILNDDASGSIADVACFSSFNRMTGSWMLLMRRALSTGNIDDIDFTAPANADSVMMSISFMNHNDSLHYGSQPFYIVFP